MAFLPISEESLNQAAQVLRSGGIVAFPTETVYGLGADAFNEHALAKVFEAKGRPLFDPLIIHIAAIEMLEKAADLSILSDDMRGKLFLLAENLWPGPLSIVLPKNQRIPGIATAGLATAAVRFPDHFAAQKLISLSTGALAAPSANPFGSLSPTRAEHVRDKLGGKIDIILDGGPVRVGVESTVVDITEGGIKILRPGGTPKEVIEDLVRAKSMEHETSDFRSAGFVSPGLLKSHYAPDAALSVFTRQGILEQPYIDGAAFLFFDGSTRDLWLKANEPPKTAVVMALSEGGDMLEAASRLFETLHKLDNCNILRIFAQFAPAGGLGEAINDRLKRASA